MALLEVRKVWKARRSAGSVRLELLDPDAALLQHDVCRDAVLALPFGDETQGRAVVQVTVEHSEEREDPPNTPHQGVMPPSLSKQFFRCALTAKARCTAPLANRELPTVEQLTEAVAATISQRINTAPELQHAQWLTGTMMAAGLEMPQHHTEPTLLCIADDNLCAISLGKEDEEFADTLPGSGPYFSCRTTAGAQPAPAPTATARTATATTGVQVDDEAELELNYEDNDSTMDVGTAQRGAAEAPGRSG
eukprot:jgi/Tetstr1/423190/TSEL_001310.t1